MKWRKPTVHHVLLMHPWCTLIDGGYDVEVVDIWTGQRANALRAALRMTNEAFAEKLGTAVRTVAKWNAQPDVVPVSELQRALDTTLSRASAEERAQVRYPF